NLRSLRPGSRGGRRDSDIPARPPGAGPEASGACMGDPVPGAGPETIGVRAGRTFEGSAEASADPVGAPRHPRARRSADLGRGSSQPLALPVLPADEA